MLGYTQVLPEINIIKKMSRLMSNIYNKKIICLKNQITKRTQPEKHDNSVITKINDK